VYSGGNVPLPNAAASALSDKELRKTNIAAVPCCNLLFGESNLSIVPLAMKVSQRPRLGDTRDITEVG
jgi:hypothetical protein